MSGSFLSNIRFLAIHDARLQGKAPTRWNMNVIDVDQNTSLLPALDGINSAALFSGRGKLDAVFILCHGYAGANNSAQVSMDAGGMGLQLGKEDVLHANVNLWGSIKDKVDNIVVYACAAGDTQPGNAGTRADGKYLMGALALATNASVFAADKLQWYNTDPNGLIVYGAWEGTLWNFPPDGSGATQVRSAPVEFDDVIAGIAA